MFADADSKQLYNDLCEEEKAMKQEKAGKPAQPNGWSQSWVCTFDMPIALNHPCKTSTQ